MCETLHKLLVTTVICVVLTRFSHNPKLFLSLFSASTNVIHLAILCFIIDGRWNRDG